jgi:acetyl esterase/lipase
MHALLVTLLLAASTDPGVPSVERDVVYHEIEGFPLRLDAYLPGAPGPHPAVVLLHGGAWIHGGKEDVREFGEILSAKGFACFAVQYRLAPTHRFPAQIEDCQRAVQFLRAEAERFELDPERIGALGLSAGGHLAALLGVLDDRRDEASADPVARASSRVQAVVSYFGPVLLERAPTRGFDTQAPPELFGDAPDELYAAASPLHAVTRDDAPFLLIHGDKDDTVPVQHSELMKQALKKVNVQCRLIVIEGGGHGDFFYKDRGGAYWKTTERFLAERLQRAPARATPASAVAPGSNR